MRSSDLADRMGIARSTTHRLLSTLVYRGFAQQDEARRYNAGPAMRSIEMATAAIAELRAVSISHLQALRDMTKETVSLQVLSGAQVRFVATVESTHLLKVGDRDGLLFPAWDLSGGRVLLAALRQGELRERLIQAPDFDGESFDALEKSLASVRRRGFAINDQRKRTEREVTAIAQPVCAPDGNVLAAISVAMPTSRFGRDKITDLNTLIAKTVADIESDLSARTGQPDAV
ncbi:IclR family transcriptional regulator [Arthrobacter sp. zg-Y820]|nr:IclR family transcriptional regulator [Arthrobacter sp. zg-Y820]